MAVFADLRVGDVILVPPVTREDITPGERSLGTVETVTEVTVRDDDAGTGYAAHRIVSTSGDTHLGWDDAHPVTVLGHID